jgi:hypothetical protein
MKTRPTAHPEVLEVVGPDAAAGRDLDRIVRRLEEAALQGDRVSIDSLLAEVVPGFKPAVRPWDVNV